MRVCLNKNHPDVKKLSSELGESNVVTAARISVWQQTNSTEDFPTKDQLIEAPKADKVLPKLNDFLLNVNPNFRVEIVDNMSTAGLTNFRDFVVSLRTGDELPALSEEAAHVYFELLPKDVQEEAIKWLIDTPIYRQTLEEYKDVYTVNGKPDIKKIQHEAMGKAIALMLMNNLDVSKALTVQNQSVIKRIMDWFRKAFGIIEENPLVDFVIMAANDILEGDASKQVDTSAYDELLMIKNYHYSQALGMRVEKKTPIVLTPDVLKDSNGRFSSLSQEIRDNPVYFGGIVLLDFGSSTVAERNAFKRDFERFIGTTIRTIDQDELRDGIENERYYIATSKTIRDAKVDYEDIGLGVEIPDELIISTIGKRYTGKQTMHDTIIEEITRRHPTDTLSEKMMGIYERLRDAISRADETTRGLFEGGRPFDYSKFNKAAKAISLGRTAEGLKLFLDGIKSVDDAFAGLLNENFERRFAGAEFNLVMKDISYLLRLSSYVTTYLDEFTKDITDVETLKYFNSVKGNLEAFTKQLDKFTKGQLTDKLFDQFKDYNNGIDEQFQEEIDGELNPEIKAIRIQDRDKAKIKRSDIAELLDGVVKGGAIQNFLSTQMMSALASNNPIIQAFSYMIRQEETQSDIKAQQMIGLFAEEMSEVANDLTSNGENLHEIGEKLTYEETTAYVKKTDDGSEIVERKEKFFLRGWQGSELVTAQLEKERADIERAYEALPTKTEENTIDYNLAIVENERKKRLFFHTKHSTEVANAYHHIWSNREYQRYKVRAKAIQETKLTINIDLASPFITTSERYDLLDLLKTLDRELKILREDPNVVDLIREENELNERYYDDNPNYMKFFQDLAKVLEENPETQRYSAMLNAAKEQWEDTDDLSYLKTVIRQLNDTNIQSVKEFLRRTASLFPSKEFWELRRVEYAKMSLAQCVIDPSKFITGETVAELRTAFNTVPRFSGTRLYTEAEVLAENPEGKYYYISHIDRIDQYGEGERIYVVKNQDATVVASRIDDGVSDIWEDIIGLVTDYREKDGSLNAYKMEKTFITIDGESMTLLEAVRRKEQRIADIRTEMYRESLGESNPYDKQKIEQFKIIKQSAEELDRLQSKDLTDDFIDTFYEKSAYVDNKWVRKLKRGTRFDVQALIYTMINDSEFISWIEEPSTDMEEQEFKNWIKSSMVEYPVIVDKEIHFTNRIQYSYVHIQPVRDSHFDIRLQFPYQSKDIKEAYKTPDELKYGSGYMPTFVGWNGTDYTYNQGHANTLRYMDGGVEKSMWNQSFFDMQSTPHLKKAHNLLVNKIHLGQQKDVPNYMKSLHKVPTIAKKVYEGSFTDKLRGIKNELLDRRNAAEEGLRTPESVEENRGMFTWMSNLFKRVIGIEVKAPATTQYVYTDEDGYERKQIYIPYSGYMEPKDVSNDIFESVLVYASGVDRANRMKDFIPFYTLLSKTLEKAGVKSETVKGFGGKSAKLRGVNATKTQLDDYADQTIYGRKLAQSLGDEGFGRFVMMFLRKMRKMKVFQSMSILNYKSNIKNYIAGEATNFIHGGQLYSNTAYASTAAKAHSFIMKGFFEDMKKDFKDRSIDYKLLHLFNANGDNMIHKIGVVGNKKRTLTNSDNLVYAGIMAGENVISAHYIFATLKHQKVKTQDGSSISVQDAFELDANGNLKIKDGVEMTWKDVADLVGKIKAFRYQTQGQTDERSVAERNPWGSLAFAFRRYFLPAVMMRIGGSMSNLASGRYEKGYYLEAAQFIGRALYFSIKNKQLLYMKTGSKREKEALARLAKDTVMFLAFLQLLSLFGYDDDDKDRFKKLKHNTDLTNLIIFELFAVQTELGQLSYIPQNGVPNMLTEPWRTVNQGFVFWKTPLELAKSMIEIVTLEEYDKSNKAYDIKKGDLKGLHRFKKVIGWGKFTEDNATSIRSLDYATRQ